MKKYSSILENLDNSKLIEDFKDAIVELFDDELKIRRIHLTDKIDINNVYIFDLTIYFMNDLNSNSYLHYKKLFDIFYDNEIEFKFDQITLYSSGLLSDIAEILEIMKPEIDAKKYNL